MESNIKGSSVVYQSLSYEMIKELLKNKETPAWIKIWLYFSILQKYKKTIYAKNPYISQKLDIPLGTVKYAISKLQKDGLIIISNKGTWARQIQLTKIANISENENKELSNNNEAYYHSLYDRSKYKDHVYLSNDEYQALLDKVKDETELDRYITGIDIYLEKAVVKYESHFKLISIWIDKDITQVKNKKKKFDAPNYLWYKTIERGRIENKSTAQDKDLQDLLDFDWLTEDTE